MVRVVKQWLSCTGETETLITAPSIHKAGCLSSPCLVLKVCTTPGEHWSSYVGNVRKLVAGMPQEQNYRSELPHHTLTRLYMLFEKDSVQC